MSNQVLEVPRGLTTTLPREHTSLLNSLVGKANGIAAQIAAASVAAATQAEAEAGSATNVYISPGIAAFLPPMPKALILFDASSGSPIASLAYNVSSVTDRGAGLFTINFTRPFSSTAIGMFGSADNGAGAGMCTPDTSVAVSVGAFPIQVRTSGGVLTDMTYNFAAFFGDLT